jgi:hypothetical protein
MLYELVSHRGEREVFLSPETRNHCMGSFFNLFEKPAFAVGSILR